MGIILLSYVRATINTKKTDRIKGVAGIDRQGNVDTRTQPTGTTYLYYSKDKAALFKIFIEEKNNPDKIHSYQYYTDLATCLIKEVEPFALPCNCKDSESEEIKQTEIKEYYSQNDPVAIRGDGSDVPISTIVEDIPDSPYDASTEKMKWINNLVFNDLKFYGRGWDDVPFEQRVYQSEFEPWNTEFIGYELNIGSSPPNGDIEFLLEEIWYNNDGSVRFQKEVTTQYPKDWKKAYYKNSLGNRKRYNWPVGDYRLEIKIDGNHIGERTFKVSPSPPAESYREWLASIESSELKIFESDKDRKDKIYSEDDTFDQSSVRYINFYTCLKSKPPTSSMSFKIDCKYYDDGGNKIAEFSQECLFGESYETRCYEQGYGSEKQGSFFKKGSYVLEISIDDKIVDSKSFKIQ